jgi:hypothetical protein
LKHFSLAIAESTPALTAVKEDTANDVEQLQQMEIILKRSHYLQSKNLT